MQDWPYMFDGYDGFCRCDGRNSYHVFRYGLAASLSLVARHMVAPTRGSGRCPFTSKGRLVKLHKFRDSMWVNNCHFSRYYSPIPKEDHCTALRKICFYWSFLFRSTGFKLIWLASFSSRLYIFSVSCNLNLPCISHFVKSEFHICFFLPGHPFYFASAERNWLDWKNSITELDTWFAFSVISLPLFFFLSHYLMTSLFHFLFYFDFLWFLKSFFPSWPRDG
jgi:hypothetical protein